MTSRRGMAALALVGLMGLCLGLGLNIVVGNSGSADEVNLEISSIDLASGAGDATIWATNMMPGDTVATAVTVANSGRQPMNYAVSRGLVAADGAILSKALVLTIKTIGSSCADFDGTTLFDGPLDEAGFGNEGSGRSLPGATAEILCFRAALPLAADNQLQGLATTVSLSFGSIRQAATR
jgi:hypothetical protein